MARESGGGRRVLFCGLNSYLDDSNGAAVASRAMMETLGRRGFAVEAITGSALEFGPGVDPAAWLAERGVSPGVGDGSWLVDTRGVKVGPPPPDRIVIGGVPLTLHRGMAARSQAFDAAESREFLALYEATLDRFRPDVLVNYGGDALSREVRARARGIAVVFPLHNFSYPDPRPFADADAVIVPSRFAADHYRRALGLDCTVLPNLIDFARVRPASRDPRYVTFINPSYEKGVYVFARIADELGRRRPDIPVLVVEGRGTERTLADCGLDLRAHGNVGLMAPTPDPRRFWGMTKVCLMPSLWWENQPLVAIEAMVNGIPVIGSDRGGLPEALGEAGVVLPIPARLTPQTRELPTSEEVAPWVDEILRLCDDPAYFTERCRRSSAEASRWTPDALEPVYIEFFSEIEPSS